MVQCDRLVGCIDLGARVCVAMANADVEVLGAARECGINVASCYRGFRSMIDGL